MFTPPPKKKVVLFQYWIVLGNLLWLIGVGQYVAVALVVHRYAVNNLFCQQVGHRQ